MINSTLDGRYIISRILGEGGMGIVYEGQHRGTGRRVAVKVITTKLAEADEALARFEREARAAGAIDSEHIVQVFDSGKDPESGRPFLVMELLSGEGLTQLMRRLGPLPPHLALCITAQACMGLQRAHAAGVVHRDIKPANIYLARRDADVTVKLLDFGIAKLCADEAAAAQPDLTGTTGLVGSPMYMSPEQARSLKDIDARSDLWSLGVVLYHMLAGRPPHERGLPLGEMLIALCTTPVPPLQRFAPWVPPEVAAIVHCALQHDRALRFESAAAMLAAVRALLPAGHAIREEMLVPMTESARAVVASTLPLPDAASFGGPTSQPAPSAPVDVGALAALSSRPSAEVQPVSSVQSDAGSARERTGENTTTPAIRNPSLPAQRRSPWARRTGILLGGAVLCAVAVAGALVALRPQDAARAAASLAPFLPKASAQPQQAAPSADIDPERLASFGPLPDAITSSANPLTDEKIALGRMLFYDKRLSRNHDISCNSCHLLDRHGVDGARVPTGHAHQQGRRNTPTVYNSAGYNALFWDGRIDVLEEQASMPLLNPAEMAMDTARVVLTLRSMPEYVDAFVKAFPREQSPVTLKNTARALAAFERKLFARGRWDEFLQGQRAALTDAEKHGFNAFVDTGCVSCHFGPHVGATMFQKLGLVKAWPDTMDRGRFDITQRPADFMVFRVPSLRDIAVTGPYFHDGSIASLDEAVRLMARHQLGKELSDETVHSIVTWLGTLTGNLPDAYIAKPKLPSSTGSTPVPIPD